MNYCPSCGTANRDGSRFCNECGHRLPSKTGIVCPMCSHMNPAVNVYCDKCQARLVPAAPGSQPAATGGVPAPRGAGAAPIKKGLSLPTKPTDESEPEPEPAHDETPDWLMRLRAAAPKPSETRSDVPAQPAAPVPPPSDEIPEWMQPDEGEVPDWFQRLSEPVDPSASLRAGSASPPFGRPQSGTSQVRPSPPQPSSQPADDALPDWMQDIGSLDSAQGGLVPPAEHTPPPALDAGASGEAEQDWLGQPLRAGAEFELPDWLRQLEGEAGPPAAPGEAMPSAPAEEPAAEEPDWLAAIREPSAPETPAEEAPDWLAALRDQPQTEATGEELATEAPEWLSAVSDVAEAPTAEPAVEEPSVQADVPDWLRGLTTTPAAGETVQEQEAAPASEEVAGWLREVSAGYPEPAGGVSAFIGEDIELTDQAETPDWLADVVQPPPPAAAPEPAPVEVPEWLRELGPAPAPALSSVEGAEDRPEETPFGEVPSAVAGDIPEWLRGMQPGQAPPAFADEAGRSLAPAEAGLEAAAIPSWLQALRPTEAAGAPAMPEEGVAETEGLLAELRNVLPAMPFMGQSHGAPAIRHAEIPAADLARAGLFQELLARGALAPTIVQPSLGRRARAAGGPRLLSNIRARFGYWLIAALLITSVIVPNGFSFVQNIFQLGNAGAGLYQPAAERIAALNTSDRVLLAFDYDAFQAAEMDAIAQAFLTHIRQRGAEVIAVSLNPTGPALAERVLAELKDAGLPDAAFVQQRYFPGQAVGAQSALISTQADLVVVLAGSPEAMRVWVEQVSAAGLPMPIVAGVSAGVLPQVRPYVQSGQVMEPVTGLMGGLAYQRSLDSNPDAGNEALNRTVQSEALYLSQLTFAAILIIGLIVSLMAGTRRTG